MRYLLFAIVTIFGITEKTVLGQEDYCFGKDGERVQTRHFNSLTAYEIVKGTNMDKQYLVPNCEAKKMWIFHRHGTRLPNKDFIENASRLDQLRDDIVKNYESRHSKRTVSALCDVDYINLKFWKWNTSITVDQDQYLTSQGYADLRGTAKLYQRLYPQILTKDYDPHQYFFRYTNKQRSIESYKAFVEGLFGSVNNVVPEPVPENDYVLRPYDFCQSWKEHSAGKTYPEEVKYRQSELWNKTAKEISERLGYEYVLENDDINMMYSMCRFDQAWKPDRTSPWCAAFLPEHVYVLEYGYDIHSYYKGGYGYDENYRLNCRIVKDMLQQLKSPSTPNVVAYFAHSTGFETLLTALGIARDYVPLMADNYKNMTQRLWTTSSLIPFAANLVAVKYECNDQVESRENVIFFLNQNAIFFDWCKAGLCTMSDVLKRYDNFLQADCSSYYCRSGASPTVGISLVSLLMAAIVYLIY